ncbi:MAG: TIM barrel protein [Capsulimonadales bacterium]|nr:TIM barrel protein [Capsulimonadales bacterium]
MTLQTSRRVSVSTWALHPLIQTVAPGRPPSANPDQLPNVRLMEHREGTLDLLDVPAQLAAHGFTTMELCHFHLPSRDEEFVARFRAAREAAGVELWSVLIDDGDINHPEYGDADRTWILGWIDTAAALGARCVRVIAGKQPPTPEMVRRSHFQLKQLMVDAYMRGVHLMTENWFSTLSSPAQVHQVFADLGGSVGLCLDFGNWGGPDKYANLTDIAEYAESCHAKCHFADGQPDVEDYRHCLEITREAGFSGPYTLVHGEPGNVWESLDIQRNLVAPYL